MEVESTSPIEPEVAAAVENLKTWPGHERQAEIVIKGLLALRGDPSTKEVDQLEKEIRERLPGEIARTLIDALEEKAGARDSTLLQAVGRLGRLTWRSAIPLADRGRGVGLHPREQVGP